MPPHTRGDSSTPKPTKYPDLRTILRTCDSVDEAPEFAVLNAEVWTRDGRECVDLLETNLRGPFRVQGTLRVERGGERSFCKGAKNGPLEFESEILYYAIDANPEPEIWIGTLCGWLKMSPSARYEELFHRMEWSVRLLYQCEDLEEELKARKKILKVDEFLLEYALSDGRGLQEPRLVEFFEEHARSMLAHMITLPNMRKRKLFVFLRTTYSDIYDAVVAENQELEANHKAGLLTQGSGSQHPLPIRQTSPVKKQVKSSSPPSSSPAPVPAAKQKKSASRTATPEVAGEASNSMSVSIPGHPEYNTHSMGTRNGENLVHPCQVIMDLVLASDPSNVKFSAASISTFLYSHWSFWWPPLAKAMVRLWSSVVVRQLPADWKGTNVYASLVEVSKTCNAARRDEELADARKRPYRGPQSRGNRSAPDLRAISEDEWLAEAAEYDGIHRRKQKTNSEPLKRERGSVAQISGLQDLGTPAESAVSTPGNEVKEVKEVATRAEREAAHEKWKESITSRSRETSPDPYSYPVNKAKLNLAQGKKASDPRSEVATPIPTIKSKPQVEIYTKETPHSQKALPTLPQHSGKTARMKPKTLSTKRPADDYPPILPTTKRGRTDNDNSRESEDSEGDIEMNSAPPTSPPSSPSPESPPSDEDPASPTPLNPIKPQSFNMTRGPGGSMRCLAPQCHFLEHEVESKEGQERIRGHYEEHQREDPVLRLAKMEGKLNGRSVGFLMEKLRVKEEAEARERGGGGDVRVADVYSRGVRLPLGVVRRGV